MRMAPWQEVVFHGDGGVMRLTTPFNAAVYGQAEVEVQGKDLKVTRWRFPSDNHYVHQVEAFNASVLDGAPYPCPLEFSRGTQEMIDMIWAAEKA
jgi:predicted dehydrogenase